MMPTVRSNSRKSDDIEKKLDQASVMLEKVAAIRAKAWQSMIRAQNILEDVLDDLKMDDRLGHARRLGRAKIELETAFDSFDEAEDMEQAVEKTGANLIEILKEYQNDVGDRKRVSTEIVRTLFRSDNEEGRS